MIKPTYKVTIARVPELSVDEVSFTYYVKADDEDGAHAQALNSFYQAFPDVEGAVHISADRVTG